ncbi:MAG: hypothetical protein JRD89_00295 [Deltaproteobacteria bacterium]|nr:hypothetical protein [Deltaproteobacteria bacterium]
MATEDMKAFYRNNPFCWTTFEDVEDEYWRLFESHDRDEDRLVRVAEILRKALITAAKRLWGPTFSGYVILIRGRRAIYILQYNAGSPTGWEVLGHVRRPFDFPDNLKYWWQTDWQYGWWDEKNPWAGPDYGPVGVDIVEVQKRLRDA